MKNQETALVVDPRLDQLINCKKLEFRVEIQESSHKISERPDASYGEKALPEQYNFGKLKFLANLFYLQIKFLI